MCALAALVWSAGLAGPALADHGRNLDSPGYIGSEEFDRHFENRRERNYKLEIAMPNLPAPGECRLWFPGRAIDAQPAPAACEALAAAAPPGAWLVGRPASRPGEVDVTLFDELRPNTVFSVEVYDAETGNYLRRRAS